MGYIFTPSRGYIFTPSHEKLFNRHRDSFFVLFIYMGGGFVTTSAPYKTIIY